MKWILRIAGGLLAVMALAVLVLLALGLRSNAGRIVATVEISAPPQQVWQWIEEPGKMKQWISWVVDVKTPADAPQFGVGSKRTVVMKDANSGDMTMTIDSICTRSEAPVYKQVALSTPGAFDGQETYRLTDLGNNRTRIEIDGRFHYTMWIAQLMEPLITPEAKKKMDGDMAHLKSLVESNPTSAAR
jgi:carbon monoxide dehydrogenase subunit G